MKSVGTQVDLILLMEDSFPSYSPVPPLHPCVKLQVEACLCKEVKENIGVRMQRRNLHSS